MRNYFKLPLLALALAMPSTGFAKSFPKEKDPFWGEKFHVWLMDWSEDFLRIYLDGELLNNIDIREVKNGSLGNFENPFRNPQYILLNLAIGGRHGGTLQHDAFPMRYEVDYVRVWHHQQPSPST